MSRVGVASGGALVLGTPRTALLGRPAWTLLGLFTRVCARGRFSPAPRVTFIRSSEGPRPRDRRTAEQWPVAAEMPHPPGAGTLRTFASCNLQSDTSQLRAPGGPHSADKRTEAWRACRRVQAQAAGDRWLLRAALSLWRGHCGRGVRAYAGFRASEPGPRVRGPGAGVRAGGQRLPRHPCQARGLTFV